MPRNFTLIELITKGRRACDQENRDVLSAAEWKEGFSSVFGEFYGVLVDSGMRYFETEATITTDGNSSYALPSDHLGTIGVDYLADASGRRWELDEFMAQERNAYSGISGGAQSNAYAHIGANLKLYPTPPSGQTYYHVYVPQALDHSQSADGITVDVVTPDGEAFLKWGLALLGASKEESTTVSFLERQQEKARERLEHWATMRALNSPRRRIVSESDPGHSGYLPGDWRY